MKNNLIKETYKNYFYKIFSMLIGFLIIPIIINYLGNEKYGVWITILSIISWAQMGDFGIGTGLRNRITENFTLDKKIKVKQYISTGYLSLIIISFLISLLGSIGIYFINFQKVFNINVSEIEIKYSILITLFSFSINFILGLGKTIANSIHKSSLVNLSQCIYSVVLLILIIVLNKYFKENSNLISIAIVYLICTCAGNIFISIIIFKNSYLIPKLAFFEKKYLKDIFSMGVKFFLIQLCGIILFSTDSIIITNILGPLEVTKYSLIEKLFNTITTLHSILLIAIWSKVNEAYIKKNYKWIESILKKLKKTLIPLCICVLGLSLLINKIVYIWTKENYNFSVSLILVFSLYTILIAWTGINLNIINGIGNLNLQLGLYIFAAILNIPLSVYFAKYLNLGILGVKLATLICLIPIGILIPKQRKNILNKLEL